MAQLLNNIGCYFPGASAERAEVSKKVADGSSPWLQAQYQLLFLVYRMLHIPVFRLVYVVAPTNQMVCFTLTS